MRPYILSDNERRRSAALMRVNHSGEICAQALYQGQACVARNAALKHHLLHSAEEEHIHLTWCATRIRELQGRTSILTPVWAAGSFGIGVLVGLLGDKLSLGFLAETELQVTQHLDTHLRKLPASDIQSQEILKKMREDEMHHATQALEQGGVRLPFVARTLMALTAKIMTFTAHYI